MKSIFCVATIFAQTEAQVFANHNSTRSNKGKVQGFNKAELTEAMARGIQIHDSGIAEKVAKFKAGADLARARGITITSSSTSTSVSLTPANIANTPELDQAITEINQEARSASLSYATSDGGLARSESTLGQDRGVPIAQTREHILLGR